MNNAEKIVTAEERAISEATQFATVKEAVDHAMAEFKKAGGYVHDESYLRDTFKYDILEVFGCKLSGDSCAFRGGYLQDSGDSQARAAYCRTDDKAKAYEAGQQFRQQQ